MADPTIETTIENLGVVNVQEYEYFLKAFVEANMPTVDVSKGSVFYDLVIRPAAVFQTLSLKNINRYRRASSLLEISKDPSLTDDAGVDAVLSNFRITRLAGKLATGTVTITLSSNTTTAIPSGSVFTSGLLEFITADSFVGVPTSDLVTKPTDRLIKDAGSGLYSFDIEVFAAEEGSEYQLSQGEALSMQTPPSNYVMTRVTYDFSTGSDVETNSDLIKRLESGISGQTCASRRHIRALIEASYPDTLHGSVVGFGDPDMHRDQVNIFQTSFGGKSDVYVQSAVRPTTVVLSKSATLVSAAEQKWQVYFDRDEFAGVYKIVSVLLPSSTDLGTLSIVTDTREVNTSPGTDVDTFIPEIEDYTQASFSRYQTATIEFIDPNTDTAALTEFVSTQDYNVTLLKMPDIAGMQDDVVSDHWKSSHRYDDLVRAPIPCLISIVVGIRMPAGTVINETAIKNAIADRVNRLGFTDRISASVITDVIHGLIDDEAMVIMPIDLLGELISPVDGTSFIYRSGNVLIIPTDHSESISEKTVMFFVDPNDIDVYTETF